MIKYGSYALQQDYLNHYALSASGLRALALGKVPDYNKQSSERGTIIDAYLTSATEQDAIRAFRKSLRGCKDPVKISKWYSESPKIWLNRVNARLIQIEKLNKSAKPIVND